MSRMDNDMKELLPDKIKSIPRTTTFADLVSSENEAKTPTLPRTKTFADLSKESQEVKRDDLRSHSRNDARIRTGLLSKLTYEKIWLKPSDRPKQSQTCIIFDWDDTILCTTFLAPHTQLIYEPSIKFPATLQKKLSELDDVAWELISKSKKYGKTYIVTNAAEGWVELSAERFLPKVFKEI